MSLQPRTTSSLAAIMRATVTGPHHHESWIWISDLLESGIRARAQASAEDESSRRMERPFQRETLQCSCALSTVRSRPYGKGYPASAPPYMQTVRRHGWGRG
jgi:hypothetical protein